MLNTRSTLLVILFLALFFRGTLSEHLFGVTYDTTGEGESKGVKLIVEAALALNLAYFALWNRFKFTYPFIIALGYLAWSMLSGILTPGDSILDGFKYARYTFYAFLLYSMVWNQRFSRQEFKIITIFLGALFLLQVGISFVRILFFERVEWRVGTMTTGGGGLAAVFVLFALCCTMGYYFYVRNSLWIILTGLSFGLVGYASNKRTIFFMVPFFLLVCLLVFLLQNKKRINTEFIRRFLVHIVLSLFIALPVWVYGIENTGGVSSGDENLPFFDKVLHAIRYGWEYETGESEWGGGRTTGRTSTSIHILKTFHSWKLQHIVLGRGPSSFNDKSGEQERGMWGFKSLDIAYGICGWATDTIAIGLPGMFFLVAAYGLVFRDVLRFQNIQSLSNHEKAVYFGTILGFIVLFYIYFFYGDIICATPITFILLFYAALFCSPVNRLSQDVLQSQKRSYSRFGITST